MSNWTKERKARLIGALFHDIGKFQYRAERTKIRHEENSANFIREYLGKHSCLKDFIEDAARIAASHHDSSSGDISLRQADQIAAGERDEDEALQARRPLLSVFTHIDNIRPGIKSNVEDRYFLPGPISFEEIFPESIEKNNFEDEEWLIRQHKQHWDSFIVDIKAIPKDLSFPSLVNTLLAVLEKWTARVSSAGYKSLPDISLYDHLRTVAAYSDCYAEAEDKHEPFLVVEGDISGIQNFIYRITNIGDRKEKGTAKTLRGRSFYIGLLTDAVATYLLDQLELLNVHLLLNGGGGFTVLAPNNHFVQKQLPELRKEINDWLFDEYQGEISLNLVWKPFRKEILRSFGQVKKEMLLLIGEAKYHRHIDKIGDITFWQPKDFDENRIIQVCKRCGNYIPKDDDECSNCKLHKNIGQILPHAETLLLVHSGDIKVQSETDCVKIPFPRLNQTWILVRESSGKQTVHDILRTILKDIPPNNRVDVIRLNSTDFLESRFTQLSGSYGAGVGLQFRFIGKYAPKSADGDVMSFEELAEQSEGYPMLGILRMDVDSLGAIFAHGFKEEHQTLSRIANLSRLFVLFFSGYINKLAKDRNVYINYSGGDDLFVVGGWTQVIEFARAVRQDFRKFVSENPHLTISGGMVIVWPTYPIRFAAEEAGDEEENAKSLDMGKSSEKNAFSIWEKAYHWEDVEKLLEWANTVVSFINEPEVKNVALRSFIRYLKQLYDNSFDAEGNQDPLWIPKVKHKIHYMLKRRANLDAQKIESQPSEKYVSTMAKIIHDPDLMQNLAFPANYILLKTRKTKDND